MITQDLLNYIENEITRGTPKNIIQSNLLSNGWNEKDVAEGFSTIAVKNYTPAPQPQQPQVQPQVQSQIQSQTISSFTNKPTVVIKKSKAPIFIVILLLCIIGGGVYAYYNYPPLKNIINQLMPVATTTQIVDESNILATSTGSIVSSTTNQAILGIKDCGNDTNCFISSANQCQLSKAVISTNTPDPFGMGTLNVKSQYQITGKDTVNCITQIKILSYGIVFNQNTISTLLGQGKTQADINTMEANSGNGVVGTSQVCKLGLDKNMGDIINSTFINPSGNVDASSQSDLNNSVTTYNSGLICSSK
jgi:hypothetical protein